jgi:hypothetical protein
MNNRAPTELIGLLHEPRTTTLVTVFSFHRPNLAKKLLSQYHVLTQAPLLIYENSNRTVDEEQRERAIEMIDSAALKAGVRVRVLDRCGCGNRMIWTFGTDGTRLARGRNRTRGASSRICAIAIISSAFRHA